MSPAASPPLISIVTGAGGLKGIGFSIAKALSQHGPVAICGRRENTLKESVKELQQISSYPIIFKVCDIRNISQCESFVNFVLEQFKGIDILVNNSGGQFPCSAALMTSKGFSAVVNNNLCGTFNMTSAVSKRWMLPEQKGAIVNIVADVKRGFPGLSHTGAARAGVINLTKSLAIEWAPYNIRVNAVAPGTIESSGLAQYPKEVVKKAHAGILQRRFGTTVEVARLVEYLSLSESQYITGQCIYIDGGSSLFGDKGFDPFQMKVKDLEMLRMAKL
mmetsp:Transcript_9481/g.35189  ORF Transcript_9481/g.35189 Transcript_9481/m.35189 type:complete len:276 (-) Transcript_9481:71-898(-)